MQMALRSALLFVALTCLQSFSADDKPAEQKFAAILIWGTDDEKPEGKNLKDVSDTLRQKFAKLPVKWKNYYEVTRKSITIKPGHPQEVQLSDKCLVKLHQSEKGLDVELVGENKSVYKGNRPMPGKDILIVGGDDKNATAWFVVLKPE